SHGPPPDMTQDTELNARLLDSLDSFCRDWRAQHPLPNDGVDNPPRPLDNSLWEAMAELGRLGLALPESLGGAGLGAAEATVIAGGLGRWLLPPPYVPCTLLPS